MDLTTITTLPLSYDNLVAHYHAPEHTPEGFARRLTVLGPIKRGTVFRHHSWVGVFEGVHRSQGIFTMVLSRHVDETEVGGPLTGIICVTYHNGPILRSILTSSNECTRIPKRNHGQQE